MSLLETILAAQGGGAVRELAEGFGVRQDEAQQAIQALLPALAGGIKRNTAQPSGLESLLGALDKGGHEQYLENPSRLRMQETQADGNAILGHLLGSKDVSRAAAGKAAEKTGLDYGVLKRMLPVVATMAMGALAKQKSSSGGSGNDLLGAITPLLDSDGDGSVADDLFNAARKFF